MSKFNQSQSDWAKEKSDELVKDGTFSSPRQWSQKSGLGSHTVTDMIAKGSGSAKSVVALARTARLNVVEALIANGLITIDDIEQTTRDITFDELTFLNNLRSLSPKSQTLVNGLIQTALLTEQDPNESSLPSDRHPQENGK